MSKSKKRITFAERLIECVRALAADYTPRSMAAASGVSVGTMRDVLCGGTSVPSLRTISRLLSVLDPHGRVGVAVAPPIVSRGRSADSRA